MALLQVVEAGRSERSERTLSGPAGAQVDQLAERTSAGHRLQLALTAHEMRAPLVTLRALVEIMIDQRGDATPAELALLHRTRSEIENLSGLTSALLSWSGGTPSLTVAGLDLAQLVREMAASTEFEISRARVLVRGPEHLSINGDPVHLRIALANLIRNALAYSPRERPVSVRLMSRDGVARVIVSDWGPGIAQEARTAIFDPFYRGAIGLTSRSGTGLGLFLVKQIVEAHGGQVTVDNRAAGATFRLSLPIDARGRKPVVPEPRRAIARRRSMVRLAHVPTSSAG